MQERKGIVPQEGNVCVVGQGRKIERVPKERGEEVARTARKKRQEKELSNIQVKVERKECPVRDLIVMVSSA